MSKRAIHLYEWDGGTEADQDPPEHVYCGTDGDMADEQLTNDWQYVTCKRCLKIHEKEMAARAADDRDRKVKLFDEAQAITVDVGHLNVSTAVKALIAENEALRKDAERYRWLRDKSESIHQFYLSTPIWFTGVKFSKENVDSTIDAAMHEEPQP